MPMVYSNCNESECERKLQKENWEFKNSKNNKSNPTLKSTRTLKQNSTPNQNDKKKILHLQFQQQLKLLRNSFLKRFFPLSNSIYYNKCQSTFTIDQTYRFRI